MLGYGVAGATAYVRLHGNVHWLSDVVAGSAIGLYTGAFVTNRQLFHNDDLAIHVAPTDVGGLSVQLTYTPR